MSNMKDKTEGRPLIWSSFTLIVTFVCLSLVGLALVPLLPVKLSPSHDMPGLSVSFSMPGNSARVVEAEVTVWKFGDSSPRQEAATTTALSA